jgi:halocyanin-like protein
MDDTLGRRAVLAAVAGSVAATAGCLGGDTEGGPYDGWLSNANDFEAVVDRTGRGEVQVAVGAGSGLSFDPVAVRVSPGTTIRWEWTSFGGGHNVVEENGVFESELLFEEGSTFSHTLDEPGVYRYVCTPHQTQGMLGVVEVVDE